MSTDQSRGKKRERCPNEANHTPHPEGYLAHADWAEEMLKTHRQKRCPGCGLWAIWEPKTFPLKARERAQIDAEFDDQIRVVP